MKPFFLISLTSSVFAAFLLGCGQEHSNNDLPPSKMTDGPSLSSNGNDRGNGGDTVDRTSDSAWFAENTAHSKSGPEEHKIVHYCLEVSPSFPITVEILRKKVQSSFSKWKEYFEAHRAFENNQSEKRLTLNWQESLSCGEDTDLTFLFGVSNPRVDLELKKLHQPWAMSLRTNYDPRTTWGRGYVWISDNGVYPLSSAETLPFGKSVQKWPDWDIPYAFEGLLLHELGHVFGAGHFDGTIMSRGIVDTIKAYYTHMPKELKNIGTRIDWLNDLVACYECDSKFGYTGKLGSKETGDQTFKKLMGRPSQGKVQSLLLISDDNLEIKLKVQDELGSKIFPLTQEQSASEEDTFGSGIGRLKIAYLETGRESWKYSEMRGRSGNLIRSITVSDGIKVPVKVIFNQSTSILKPVDDEDGFSNDRATLIWRLEEKPSLLFYTYSEYD